jgi:GxxExxY protein
LALSYPELVPLTSEVIHAAIEVHSHLGPGLLENIYEEALNWELVDSGLSVRRQHLHPIIYKAHVLPGAYRLDLLVNDAVVVEVKSVEKVIPVHKSQVRTYLQMTHCHVGLIFNFNVEQMRDGIFRIVL